jgi:hypothetical protein
MDAGGPTVVMAFNSKIQRENPPPGRRNENSVMTSIYGGISDNFIDRMNEIK